jgi:glycosyltransferase involved in cell wall biosynthesis
MNVGVVIPSYNVGERLSTVLSKTLIQIPKNRIYVVDDGSTDDTAAIVRQAGVKWLHHLQNIGKGAALRTGIRKALDDAAEAIFIIDGDGQHDPDRIPAFLDVMRESGCDVVFGVRPFPLGRMPFDRIISNTLSSLVVSAVVRQKIRDSQCGYRLYRAGVLEKMPIVSDKFEVETEMLIKTIRMGCRIQMCAIPTTYFGSGSHIHRLTDTFRFSRLILRSCCGDSFSGY